MTQMVTINQDHNTPQDALAHYGVKGMRWGVRKDGKEGSSQGPVSRSPKKQEKIDSKVANLHARAAKADVAAKECDDLAAASPNTFLGRMDAKSYRNMAEQNRAYSAELRKTAEAVESGRLTPQQKRLIIGGAVVGGLVLASYGASKVESGELNSLKLRGQAAIRGKKFDFARKNEFAYAASPQQVMDRVVPGINPGYATPGGQMNCRRCTFAYELRRRGYDVTATTSAVGYGQSETGLLNALSPGKRNVNRSTSLSQQVVSGAGIRGQARGDIRRNIGERTTVHRAADHKVFLSKLREQPDGARGEVVFNFGAFGHSLAYERFKGETYIFDNQKGKSYKVDNESDYMSFVDKWGGAARLKEAEITRLDNVDLDHNFLSRWATNTNRSRA